MKKSKEMRWTGYLARMGKKNYYMILVRKPEGRYRHKWTILLLWILKKYDWVLWRKLTEGLLRTR
jgi:hypothetical protein